MPIPPGPTDPQAPAGEQSAREWRDERDAPRRRPPAGTGSVYAAKRSRARIVALIAAAVVVAAAAVVAVTSLGASSSGKRAVAASTTVNGGASPAKRSHKPHKAAAKAPSVPPAETSVAVLNATEAEGLAHRTASALQQNGYSQATALQGKPPGSGQVSVVEYASGHEAEAEGVAQSLRSRTCCRSKRR